MHLTNSCQHLQKSVYHLQVLMIFFSTQIEQVTSQHHLNVHLQLTFSLICLVSYPLPQHRSSQPSTPRDVALQILPNVPNDPVVLLGQQKSGESSEYTRSFLLGGLIVAPSGMKLRPSFPAMTLAAPSNFSLRRLPTSRKEGNFLQQERRVHDPERP